MPCPIDNPAIFSGPFSLKTASMKLPSWLNSIHHDGSEKYVSRLKPSLGETVRLRLRIVDYAPIRRVVLRTFPDGEQMLANMHRSFVSPPVQWWEIDLPISQPVEHYRFIIDSDDGIWHYSAIGHSTYVPLDNTDFRILADYHAPDWTSSAVFYQIFPDRFANGDPATNPSPDEFEFRGHRPQTYPWELPPPDDQMFPLVYYGGDLVGIEQRLDYLDDLGIDAIYLNPVFQAFSNHKYDVADYSQVDPHLGGDRALISLREALDARGMRFILDIVPNHCGFRHPWFLAAQADSQSPESEFFTFHNHPNDYATWLGVKALPKLNYRSRELRYRIYEGQDAVFRRWLKPPFSADGWRVDVANMLGRSGATQIGLEISRGIRQAVKGTNQDAYLMGENFFDASHQLQGDQWDGVMNYDGFTHPLWYWLTGYQQGAHGFSEPLTSAPWPTAAMTGMWQSRLAAIPWVIALQQYNLLGSHDTPRIRSVVGDNDALHRLAITVLLAFPGIPGLYYGDEIGMADIPALGSRGCMIWDETRWNHSLRDYHRLLIRLRRTTPVLQRGGFQILLTEPDTIAFQREMPGARFLVIAHRSEIPRPAGAIDIAHGGVADGTRFVDAVAGGVFTVQDGVLPLPAIQQGPMLLQEIA